MKAIVLMLTLQLPPYLVENKGALRIETPAGEVINVPEGSRFTTNSVSVRLDNREVFLDNVAIFNSGFES